MARKENFCEDVRIEGKIPRYQITGRMISPSNVKEQQVLSSRVQVTMITEGNPINQ